MAVTCSKCEKSFCKNSVLNRHLREKHGHKEGNCKEEKQPLQCVLCNRVFKRKEHLKGHMDAVHFTGKKIKCSFCDYMTVHKYTLSRHIKQIHTTFPNSSKSIPAEDKITPYHCLVCDKQFKMKKHMNYHLRIKHSYLTTVPLIKKKCPICHFFCTNPDSGMVKQNMYKHFEEVHNTPMEEEQMQFESFSKFNAWKSNTEEQNISKFIRFDRHTKRKHTFVCHRSGKFESVGSGKRCKKIDGFCPAAITATIKDDGKVQVSFLKTHVGHQNELKHITLTTEERQKIAANTNSGPNSFEVSIIRGLSKNTVNSEVFVDAKKAFIGDLMKTLRSSITSTEELNAVRNHCQAIQPMLESIKSLKTSIQSITKHNDHTPVNANICKQGKFLSTKKLNPKKKTSNSTTLEEKNVIALQLMTESS